ncbi:hypothetical protein HMI56_000447, partial [Coelomomyces lativittatus]
YDVQPSVLDVQTTQSDESLESRVPCTPKLHEYPQRGYPMDWFTSNYFNPYELSQYSGGDFNTFIQKFQRRIKQYEGLSKEDQVSALYKCLNPATQILICHSLYYQKKVDLKVLVGSIHLLICQSTKSKSVSKIVDIYCEEVGRGAQTLEQFGVGCLKLCKENSDIPPECKDHCIFLIADLLTNNQYE